MYGPLQPDDEYEENKDVDQLVSPQVPPSISPACSGQLYLIIIVFLQKKKGSSSIFHYNF